MTPTTRERFLVLRAQAGDREALDQLLRGLQGPLGGYLRRLLGDAALAEDVLQDVFVLLYRKLVWLRDPGLFRPWAYRIASREAVRRARRERRWSEQERDPAVLEQVAGAEASGLEPDVRAALDQLVALLSPQSRAVVELHYFGELTLQEIALALGVSPGTVKSRLAYGLQMMRRAIQEARVPIAARSPSTNGGSDVARD